ncbi:MAG: hypothetical protein ACRBFS_08000 [Aureispira sp.]
MSNNTNQSPKCVLVTGKMHSGKTHFLEQLMAVRTSVLVYNAGKPSDWADYLLIHLEVEQDLLYFWYKEQRYPFQEYMRHLHGKHVKCFAGDDIEKQLFIELSQVEGQRYAGLNFVFDDTTGRMKDGRFIGKQVELVSRAKHAGVQLYITFHGWGHMPIKGWDFITHAICFAVKTAPPDKVKNKLKESANLEIIQRVHTILSKKAPRYSYARIDLENHRWELFGAGGTKFQFKNMEDNQTLDQLKPLLPIIEMAIEAYLKKFLDAFLEEHQADSKKVWARLTFGEELKMLVKEGKKQLTNLSYNSKELAETIVTNSKDPEAIKEIPSVVTSMLPMLGIDLSEIITVEIISALLHGDVFQYSCIYIGLIEGKQTYSIKQNNKLTSIKFKDLWKMEEQQ